MKTKNYIKVNKKLNREEELEDGWKSKNKIDKNKKDIYKKPKYKNIFEIDDEIFGETE